MSEGVEWAAHCCILLDWIDAGSPVSTAALAESFDLPPPYLNKQLQALVRAGILTSSAGAKGGFELARSLESITLLDVVAAVEGDEHAFRCSEIRQRGLGASTPKRAFQQPCQIAAAMHAAELEWRVALAAQSLASIQRDAESAVPTLRDNARTWYLNR